MKKKHAEKMEELTSQLKTSEKEDINRLVDHTFWYPLTFQYLHLKIDSQELDNQNLEISYRS